MEFRRALRDSEVEALEHLRKAAGRRVVIIELEHGADGHMKRVEIEADLGGLLCTANNVIDLVGREVFAHGAEVIRRAADLSEIRAMLDDDGLHLEPRQDVADEQVGVFDGVLGDGCVWHGIGVPWEGVVERVDDSTGTDEDERSKTLTPSGLHFPKNSSTDAIGLCSLPL